MNVVALPLRQVEQNHDLKSIVRTVANPGFPSGLQNKVENVPTPLIAISLICGKDCAYGPRNLGHRSFPAPPRSFKAIDKVDFNCTGGEISSILAHSEMLQRGHDATRHEDFQSRHGTGTICHHRSSTE
jgi:hypothetical protein